MEQETKFATIFGNEPDIPFEEKIRVVNELTKIGNLTFKVSVDEGGWNAECNEIPAIITGNTNPTPSSFEIESLIREAIFSAFGVRFNESPAITNHVVSPFQFKFDIPQTVTP